jgi:hypothetical protein
VKTVVMEFLVEIVFDVCEWVYEENHYKPENGLGYGGDEGSRGNGNGWGGGYANGGFTLVVIPNGRGFGLGAE